MGLSKKRKGIMFPVILLLLAAVSAKPQDEESVDNDFLPKILASDPLPLYLPWKNLHYGGGKYYYGKGEHQCKFDRDCNCEVPGCTCIKGNCYENWKEPECRSATDCAKKFAKCKKDIVYSWCSCVRSICYLPPKGKAGGKDDCYRPVGH